MLIYMKLHASIFDTNVNRGLNPPPQKKNKKNKSEHRTEANILRCATRSHIRGQLNSFWLNLKFCFVYIRHDHAWGGEISIFIND